MPPQITDEIQNVLSDISNFFEAQKNLYGDEYYTNDKKAVEVEVKVQADSVKEEISKPDRRELLKKLFFQTKNCQQCDLSKFRKNVVFGAGNTKTEIMLICDFPNEKDNNSGRPLSGNDGELLDKVLNAIQLSRETIFVTNLVKCFSANNKIPNDQQCNSCLKILEQQIEILAPNYILLMGDISANYLLKNKLHIEDQRGNVHNYGGIKTVVTYHPRELLKNPQLKRGAWEDIQLFQKLLK